MAIMSHYARLVIIYSPVKTVSVNPWRQSGTAMFLNISCPRPELLAAPLCSCRYQSQHVRCNKADKRRYPGKTEAFCVAQEMFARVLRMPDSFLLPVWREACYQSIHSPALSKGGWSSVWAANTGHHILDLYSVMH